MELGSGILDPGSGKKPIPDPGPGVKKAPDPGSATLHTCNLKPSRETAPKSYDWTATSIVRSQHSNDLTKRIHHI
jgi:hypothetical protein